MTVDPWPPILAHNLTVGLFTICIGWLCRNRHLTVAAAVLVGLLSCALWTNLTFTYEAAWRDFIWELVLRPARLFELNEERFLGTIFHWILPVVTAYFVNWAARRPEREQGCGHRHAGT